MPLRMPINSDALHAITTGFEPALKDRKTGEPKRDPDTGQPIYTVHLTVTLPGEVRPQVWAVKVIGEPKGLQPGPVKLTGLMAIEWEMEGRKGIRFEAESIAPAGSTTGSSPKQAA